MLQEQVRGAQHPSRLTCGTVQLPPAEDQPSLLLHGRLGRHDSQSVSLTHGAKGFSQYLGDDESQVRPGSGS